VPSGGRGSVRSMLLAITTTGKVVLILVGGTFIVFSLLVSMVIPRRVPGFPGKNLPAFVAVCALLFGAQIAAVAWVTGTQEVEAASAEPPSTPEPPTTPPPSTTAPTTESTTTQPETTAPAPPTNPPTTTEPPTTAPSTTVPATDPGDATAGKAIFTGAAGCTGCHTLKDAGSTGTVGPNLDEKKPSYSRVIDRVTHGKGVMPSFSDSLSATDIENVAKYVSTVAGT
jgi:cytochrome c6